MNKFIYQPDPHPVLIEVSMEKPVHNSFDNYWLDVTCRKQREVYEKHLSTAPRLPIIGEVPKTWVIGGYVEEGEFEKQHQVRLGFSNFWIPYVKSSKPDANDNFIELRIVAIPHIVEATQ